MSCSRKSALFVHLFVATLSLTAVQCKQGVAFKPCKATAVILSTNVKICVRFRFYISLSGALSLVQGGGAGGVCRGKGAAEVQLGSGQG